MKKLKAQQITEFMLATPLLIMFFVILTEYAFAFNANLVFTNSLKSSVSAYYANIDTDMTQDKLQTAVATYIKNDLQNNRIPNLDSLQVRLIRVGENVGVVGNYTYKPGFTFSFLPALKTINMNSVAIYPIPVQSLGGYEKGISTNELNLIQPFATPEEGGRE